MRRLILYGFLFLPVLLAQPVGAQPDSALVYVFLSETCPICKSVTLELRDLHRDLQNRPVKITGVFPGTWSSTRQTRAEFARKYRLDFPLTADARQELVRKYGATITPEVIMVSSRTGNILYRGMINNGFESVGRRRQVITERYLHDALMQFLAGQPVTSSQTRPVGCFIQPVTLRP